MRPGTVSYREKQKNWTTFYSNRQYWLECFEESLDKFVAQAIKSQPSSPDAPARAQKFREKYISRLRYLKQHPW